MDRDKKKTIFSNVIALIMLLAVIVMLWGIFIYPSIKAEEIRSDLGDDFNFEVEHKIDQIGNNSALLYLAIELPKGFNNSDNNLKAEVASIRSSFDHGYNDLYLGTNKDLLFVQNGSKLENYLTVPDGELLTVDIEISMPMFQISEVTLEEKTIEVKT